MSDRGRRYHVIVRLVRDTQNLDRLIVLEFVDLLSDLLEALAAVFLSARFGIVLLQLE